MTDLTPEQQRRSAEILSDLEAGTLTNDEARELLMALGYDEDDAGELVSISGGDGDVLER